MHFRQKHHINKDTLARAILITAPPQHSQTTQESNSSRFFFFRHWVESHRRLTLLLFSSRSSLSIKFSFQSTKMQTHTHTYVYIFMNDARQQRFKTVCERVWGQTEACTCQNHNRQGLAPKEKLRGVLCGPAQHLVSEPPKKAESMVGQKLPQHLHRSVFPHRGDICHRQFGPGAGAHKQG